MKEKNEILLSVAPVGSKTGAVRIFFIHFILHSQRNVRGCICFYKEEYGFRSLSIRMFGQAQVVCFVRVTMSPLLW